MIPIDIMKFKMQLIPLLNKMYIFTLKQQMGPMPAILTKLSFQLEPIFVMLLSSMNHGKITGDGPYRVGLKLAIGWVYAEGLTHFEMDESGRLLLAGLDYSGKLAVALQISHKPFE